MQNAKYIHEKQAYIDRELMKLAEVLKQPIVCDGIADVQEYARTKYRILWIAKEPHIRDGDYDFDYKEGISKVLKETLPIADRFWDPLKWATYGILNGFILSSLVPEVENSLEVYKILAKTAFINLSKCPGGGTADMENLERLYHQHFARYVKMQIDLAQPDIVICLGTFHIVEKDLITQDYESFAKDYRDYKDNGQQIVLDCMHPSFRGSQDDIENYSDDMIKAAKSAFMRRKRR